MINRIMLFFVSFCLLAAMVNCGNSSATQQIFQDDQNEIQVKKGEIFKIILPSNIGTGYSWELQAPLDSTYLKFVDKEYIENDLMTEEEESREIWRFQAFKKGQSTIQMIYKRPWEKVSEDAKERQFEVSISE